MKKKISEMTAQERDVEARLIIGNMKAPVTVKKSLLFLPPLAILVGTAAMGVVGGAASQVGTKITDYFWPDDKK